MRRQWNVSASDYVWSSVSDGVPVVVDGVNGGLGPWSAFFSAYCTGGSQQDIHTKVAFVSSRSYIRADLSTSLAMELAERILRSSGGHRCIAY